MPNLERIEKVMKYIEDHPEEHDQDSWGQKTSCGTTRCFAGTAMHLFKPENLIWYGGCMDVKSPTIEGSFMTQARKVLDLDYSQADALFYGTENAKTLRQMVDELHTDPNSDLAHLREDDEYSAV